MAGLLVIFILALLTLMVQQKLSEIKLKKLQDDAIGAAKEAEEAKAKAEKAEKDSTEAALALKEEKDQNKEVKAKILAGVVKLSEIEKIRIQILNEIAKVLQSKGIKVEISDNSTVLRIPEDTLAFDTGKWKIPRRSEDGISEIGDIIYRAITKDNRLDYLDTIFVEGHTDSLPLQREMGNWGLSTYRAISVWQHWENASGQSSQLAELENHEGKPVFSVSGYEATRRLVKNDITDEMRRRNRRIDLRFTMKSVDKTDLEQILRTQVE
ncbi:OmpA family protein [Akkermansiaceae bacterium]|nr:OmpA family protein [Akkermansiaceae bacterium]MDB4740789.1 OmpA family protein [Akkermansiaceae bacterium]